MLDAQRRRQAFVWRVRCVYWVGYKGNAHERTEEQCHKANFAIIKLCSTSRTFAAKRVHFCPNAAGILPALTRVYCPPLCDRYSLRSTCVRVGGAAATLA